MSTGWPWMSRCPCVHIDPHCVCLKWYLSYFIDVALHTVAIQLIHTIQIMPDLCACPTCIGQQIVLPQLLSCPAGDPTVTNDKHPEDGRNWATFIFASFLSTASKFAYQLEPTTIALNTNSNNHNCCWFQTAANNSIVLAE